MKSILRTCSAVVAASCVCLLAPLAQGNLLDAALSGFESSFNAIATGDNANPGSTLAGSIASGWGLRSNSATITLGADTQTWRSGTASQKIAIQQKGQGEIEFNFRLNNELAANERYRFSVWLRSDNHTRARIFVRQTGAPYQVYVSRSVEVAPEWQQFSLEGQIGSSAVRFVIAFNSNATFWVDDLSVVSAEGDASGFLSGPGNYFGVSSFESGLSGGWSAYLRGGDNLPLAARAETIEGGIGLDAQNASQGQHALTVPLAVGQAAMVTSPAVAVAGQMDYTASIALKADAQTDVQLMLTGYNLKDVYARRTVRLGQNWERFSITAQVPEQAHVRLSIRCFQSGGTTLLFDAAQLEEGSAATAWQPRYAAELALESAAPGAIYFADESPSLDIRSSGSLPQGAYIESELESLLGGTIGVQAIPANATQWQPVLPAGNQLGMFKLRARIVDAGGQPLSAQAEKIFAVIPRPRAVVAEDSAFGIHTQLRPSQIAITVATGNKWVRLHDASIATQWPVVERVRGQFEFVDDGIEMVRLAGLEILGLLNGAPAWATTSPRSATGYFSSYNVPDTAEGLSGWETYVQEITSHYNGVITHWEIWNEPWSRTFFAGGADVYAQLVKSAYEVAKTVNPDIVIVGLNTAAHQDTWTNQVLAEIGTAYFDIFAFHDYNPNFYEGAANNAFRLANKFTQIQVPYGDPKPLWDTEGGPGHIGSWYGGTEGVSPLMQLGHVVRFDTSQIAAGVKRSFYYTLHSQPESGASSYSLVEHDGSIRPALAARAVLASFIDGASYTGRSVPAAGVEAFAFEHTDGSEAIVLWSFDGQQYSVALPTGFEAFDVFGNAIATAAQVNIGILPVYFISHGN